jgi:hypothetical protein
MKMTFLEHALFPRQVEWLMRATGYRRQKPPQQASRQRR